MANQIRSLPQALKCNSKINLKKADKGTTTSILDTAQKMDEGLQQLSNDTFYKPLPYPIVQDTARKVEEMVNKLHRSEYVDLMIHNG